MLCPRLMSSTFFVACLQCVVHDGIFSVPNREKNDVELAISTLHHLVTPHASKNKLQKEINDRRDDFLST